MIKGPPGVGVVDPTKWVKGHLENKLKDAAFGSEVDAGMDVIPQKTYAKFHSMAKSDRSLRLSRGAAFTQAFNVAGELHDARALRGFGEMFFDIEKQLVILGSGTIAESQQNQVGEKIRKPIGNTLKDTKKIVYENSYSLDRGEQSVKAVWDRAAESYTIYFTGNSHC